LIGIKPEVTVNAGSRLQEDQLQRVSITRANVGNLTSFAEPYDAVKTVVGLTVSRTLEGGSLLLRTDTKTVPPELIFGDQTQPGVEEVLMGVPIDPDRLVPSLIKPGDLVSFVSARNPGYGPTPAVQATDRLDPASPGTLQPISAGTPATASSDDLEIIGPFQVLSLGTRLGSTEVSRAAKQNTAQENVMTVLVRLESGKLEPKAQRLLKLTERIGFRPLGYLLHSTQRKGT
jgi:hypothetical protein